jgi:hypothetical protein
MKLVSSVEDRTLERHYSREELVKRLRMSVAMAIFIADDIKKYRAGFHALWDEYGYEGRFQAWLEDHSTDPIHPSDQQTIESIKILVLIASGQLMAAE